MHVQVIDGANGFVGSHLAAALLARGDDVIALARASTEVVRRRVTDALLCLGFEESLVDRLRVRGLALNKPDLGLPAAEVFAERCTYWHTAALVTFFPRREEELQDVNVTGSANALATFERHARPESRYIHIGTAYQCGLDSDGPVPEDWPAQAPPDRFRNSYEHSKREAEIALSRSRSVREGNVLVPRLGVMVGHSQTGRALTDYGLYDFLRVMAFFARRTPGERVRLPCHPDANLHLTPIDTTVSRLLSLTAENREQPVFHVVNGGTVPVRDLFAVINAWLPIELVPATPEEIQEKPFNRFEAVVNMRAKYTAIYFQHHYDFAWRDMAAPPAVTLPVLDRLVSWYVREGLPE
ncbi:Male sterility protein [Sinosporangium album]|uniref:Male sterility protein n=1 Tax=Sinosporangium album TaxID=504805 RepID=A0A1G7ZPI2_9ACTN|nr:SDR family oxidoreductase [Sinosporangium album]SDH10613.1 Male sterility protein [Sinosporangium album]